MPSPQPTPRFSAMQQMLQRFEHAIVIVLIGTMGAVVVATAIELVWLVLKDLVTAPVLWLDDTELLDIFSFVLLILIGIELMETIRAYLVESVVHVDIVLEVALIAIARKVIVLDPGKYAPLTVMALAALILSLALGYYLQRRARQQGQNSSLVHQE